MPTNDWFRRTDKVWNLESKSGRLPSQLKIPLLLDDMPKQIPAKSVGLCPKPFCLRHRLAFSCSLTKRREQPAQRETFVFSFVRQNRLWLCVTFYLKAAEPLKVNTPQRWQVCSSQRRTRGSLQTWRTGRLCSLASPSQARSPFLYGQSWREGRDDTTGAKHE